MHMNPREIALNLLADNRGGYLAFDMLDHPKGPRVKLSRDELWEALRSLQKEGLVASMQERLDGPLFTLSKTGRDLMAKKGHVFDDAEIQKTRTLFSSYFYKVEI